ERDPPFGVPLGVVGVPGSDLFGGVPGAERPDLHLVGEGGHEVEAGISSITATHLSGEVAAQREAGTGRRVPDGCFELRAADSVEEYGDAVGGQRGEPLVEVVVAIVDGGVESEFVEKVAGLLRPTGNPDDVRGATCPGDLRGHRPDAAC